MKEFLEKIKLIQYFTTTLEIDQNDFVNRLRDKVDIGDINGIVDTFEIFSSCKNEYKGSVSFDKFELKKKRKIFDNTGSIAIAKATIVKSRNAITINTEIHGLNKKMKIALIALLVVYCLMLISFLFFLKNVTIGFAAQILVFNGLLLLGLPYIFMRRSISRMQRDLEKEYFSLIENSSLKNEIN